MPPPPPPPPPPGAQDRWHDNKATDIVSATSNLNLVTKSYKRRQIGFAATSLDVHLG